MPYNYSDSYLRDRVHSGPDKNRAKTVDELVAKARAGDQQALYQLRDLSGDPRVDPNPSTGWATQDAKNYTMMALRDAMPGYAPQYQKAHDGGGFFTGLGHAVGGLLEYAAPIGAAFIPGIGPIAAGAIAAGGTGLGRAIEGKPFSLKSELLAGAGGAGGNLLLGGQGVSGIGGVPARLGLGGSGATVGNATQSMPGVMGAASDGATALPGAAGAAGSGGGILGTGITPGGIMKYLPLATGALSAYGSYQNAHKANQLRDKALGMADQRYRDLAPYRTAAGQALQQGPPAYPDFSSDFADPMNPYYRKPKPFALGGATSRPAELGGGY